MYRITGLGAGQVVAEHPSNEHTIFMKAHWVIVDVTDPNNPTRVLFSTMPPTCTLQIERKFDKNFDVWEPFDVNPIALNVPDSLIETRVDGGLFRYTVTDLPVNHELWINATFR